MSLLLFLGEEMQGGGFGMALHVERQSACHKQQTINFICSTPVAEIILTELYSLYAQLSAHN